MKCAADIDWESTRVLEKIDGSLIKDSPYAWAGFMVIDTGRSADELLKTLVPSKLEKFIIEYGDNPAVLPEDGMLRQVKNHTIIFK